MQVVFIVLNKVECLDTILKEFAENGIKGATILDSRGMAHSLEEFTELHFIASLRMILDPDRQESKTIFTVIEDDQIKNVSEIVNKATGCLDKTDTGIIFTVPVSYTEGLGEKK